MNLPGFAWPVYYRHRQTLNSKYNYKEDIPLSEATSTLISSSGGKLTRQQLAAVPTPLGTATHRPVPHAEIVEALVETLGFRHIGVVNEEYAVSKDGMKMFGVLDLDTGMHGCRFSIGIRNAHDKSMRLAAVVGVSVFVCENMAFSGDFQPVLAKHSKHFSLQNALSIGVDQMQRNFDGMRKQVDSWQSIPAFGCLRQADHLPGVHRVRPGGAQAPGPAGPRSVLFAAA